jgi:hypothetical protein
MRFFRSIRWRLLLWHGVLLPSCSPASASPPGASSGQRGSSALTRRWRGASRSLPPWSVRFRLSARGRTDPRAIGQAAPGPRGSGAAESSLGTSAALSVRETGHGISTDDLPHIFERVYRADKARAHAAGRTGLGLAITRAIVEAHRGDRRGGEHARREQHVHRAAAGGGRMPPPPRRRSGLRSGRLAKRPLSIMPTSQFRSKPLASVVSIWSRVRIVTTPELTWSDDVRSG